MDHRAYIYFPMLPPRGRDAALAHARQLVDYLAAVRPVWSCRPPEIPGRYWFRAGRKERPEVVEIRADYSEPGAPPRGADRRSGRPWRGVSESHFL